MRAVSIVELGGLFPRRVAILHKQKIAMTTRPKCFPLLLSALLVSSAIPTTASSAPIAVASVHKDADGVTLRMKPGTLKLRVFSPRVVEVVYSPSNSLPAAKKFFRHQQTRAHEVAVGRDGR